VSELRSDGYIELTLDVYMTAANSAQ
jgi:hypothetical protein